MGQENHSETPDDKDAPPAPNNETKIPPSPNEGRLGPAADPAEGKRD
jgi:hypothetical protein